MLICSLFIETLNSFEVIMYSISYLVDSQNHNNLSCMASSDALVLEPLMVQTNQHPIKIIM